MQAMSQMGHERRIRTVCNISALPPEADVRADIVFRRLVPGPDSCPQQTKKATNCGGLAFSGKCAAPVGRGHRVQQQVKQVSSNKCAKRRSDRAGITCV